MTRAGVLALSLALLATPTLAKDKAPKTWQATRTTDPITGATSCVVSALDYVGKLRYSRTGYLYPVIEMSSRHGLLVGVSSGGRYRLPTGTIVWRVDDQPFRELKAEDNPQGASVSAAPTANDAATKAMADAMALSNKMVMSATATSTLASGEVAKAMLSELRAGQGLIFRAAAISSPYGLPDPNMMRVGQFQKDGLKPLPVDASLAIALAECGID
ncbi:MULTISPECIES: hypothetical protein [Sphingobium]|uniref:hypothetical protein n=1 Tax=Sphingobium TaxID=165695 RepID=UPI0015ECC9DD|nr:MULTISPECIES: hypothetical protein [Sphingobium]MCW2363123.1 hypothetical protein [Sphingobium sp. B10D3B]MCW2400197.1 hypothetical protein [Sphingobium sp. B10D7B]MCW2407175.1 hypothetical protein [Sphingobium xanthum]